MVTSRPLASDSLCPEFRESVDQHIEVLGFNDEDIKSYVEKACQKQPQILPDLLSYIASNPFVSSVMYIPLQCVILTALYIEKWKKKKGGLYAPTTLTQLYTDLLLSSLIRYISDHPVYSKCKTAAIRHCQTCLKPFTETRGTERDSLDSIYGLMQSCGGVRIA